MSAETDPETRLLDIVKTEGEAANTVRDILPEGAWEKLSDEKQQDLIDTFTMLQAEGDSNSGTGQ